MRDLAALRTELEAALGADVRFDAAHRALYASEASNYRQVPIGVVIPRSIEALAEGIAICHRHRAPVLVRGAGTSMCGQSVNEAVIFDTSKSCNRILEIDVAGRTATVEPGVICDTLRAAAEKHGLTFGPDPSTHSRCTLGGMIGNNSCGAHSVMAGKTIENVEALEVMTYDGTRFWVGPTSDEEYERIIAEGGRRGQIYQRLRALADKHGPEIRERFPRIRRRVSGFNLEQLLSENSFNVARALVGTEGTCVFVTAARVRLVPSPAHRALLVLGFDDIYAAADAVPDYERFSPLAIEGLDQMIIRGLQIRGLSGEEIALLPAGNAWVVLEFGGDTPEEATRCADEAKSYFSARPAPAPRPACLTVSDPLIQKRIWSIRENGSSATQLSVVPGMPDPKVGWEDAAVHPHQLGKYLRSFQALVERYGYETSLFGHFGEGCVHARINFDLSTDVGIAAWRSFIHEAAELVVAHGGSLSGEHGDGQARAEYLPLMFGDVLVGAMADFKRIWDPDGMMNPGKVVNPNRMDANLRMGPTYRKASFDTRMTFRSSEGEGFQRELERCVGMGRCRAPTAGTMCPSFRASGEERYSTRGRARLLWEMAQGDIIKDGWNSDEIKEALGACLACKGCRSECPTHTDMASYKAEFLSHYYETHARPRQALSMGRIGDWSALAARMPRFVNFMTQTPWLSDLSKMLAGVARDRDLPKFAARTFRRRRARDNKANAKGRKVMLWVDTFCEHFHPEIAEAAECVLADAGFDVVLPDSHLCCGRPLYDFGLLDVARARLERILDKVEPHLGDREGESFALVGLEPGCLSVFRDEMLKLFPDDPRARRLAKRTHLLGDFLHQQGYRPGSVASKILVHAHCHQKSVFGTAGEMALLKATGASVTLLDSGCCGMAGSFGFNPDHAELSRKVGEAVLLPAVRASEPTTLVLTNGFSCREQIRQHTGRRVVHLAELLASALPGAAATRHSSRTADLLGN
jgi:FAD/FMN-containing dehydrogenase/Fe-S oxidoreductase